MFPIHQACAVHDMFCSAAFANATAGIMYTDITRVFPLRSFKNMQYIFVAYIYDLNACVTTREKSDSKVNVEIKKKLTSLENCECLG